LRFIATSPSQSPNLQDHPMIEERLENIESKITFQEDQIEELNKTVYQQQQKLERLQTICEALARELRALAEAGNDGKTTNERPPHY
jgi:SlyX protein